MKNTTTNPSSRPQVSPDQRESEEIVHQLEQFPIEALEAALVVLQAHGVNQTNSHSISAQPQQSGLGT